MKEGEREREKGKKVKEGEGERKKELRKCVKVRQSEREGWGDVQYLFPNYEIIKPKSRSFEKSE